MIACDQRVEHGHVGVGLELQACARRACRCRSRAGRPARSWRPRLAAFFIQVAATGWLAVGLEPITKISSACATSLTWLLTAPEPDAFQQRGHAGGMAQARCNGRRCWSQSRCAPASGTGRPLRCCPWPSRNPASDLLPWVSRSCLSVPAARSSASSQVASRNTADQSAVSRLRCSTARVFGHAGFADQRHRSGAAGWRRSRSQSGL